MTYKITIQKKAQKFIKKQEKETQDRLLRSIYKLPDEGDRKKLQGSDLYRLRVGPYRVLYLVDQGIQVVSVENIDNRGDVYKKP